MSGKPSSLTMNSIKGESELRFLQKDASVSECSISSIASTLSVSQDENFRVSKHAENSLKIMEEYLQKQQLCDVTLIAGEYFFFRILKMFSFSIEIIVFFLKVESVLMHIV